MAEAVASESSRDAAKEAELDKRIAEIRRKNEERSKRFQVRFFLLSIKSKKRFLGNRSRASTVLIAQSSKRAVEA